jgi:murein DD-endopeptidase MepM/ murein hydrolase activator NlpD
MMRKPSTTIPMIALGAAGAFALASLFDRRAANAATVRGPASEPGRVATHGSASTQSAPMPRPAAPAAEPPRAPSSPAFRPDFGRPVPAGVRAVVASGWASARGTGPTRRLHRAIDIGLPIGAPILAIDEGIVTHVQSQDIGDAGIWTAIRHPSGISSRYIHLSRTLVKVGQQVQRGERIGLSGDTASKGVPHLHLDLRAPAAMLPAIEAAIGRPRSGWGPEMKPFGHSIPGEPFIQVDAYRDIVRTEATAMGIPLRDPGLPRNGALAYVIRDHVRSSGRSIVMTRTRRRSASSSFRLGHLKQPKP